MIERFCHASIAKRLTGLGRRMIRHAALPAAVLAAGFAIPTGDARALGLQATPSFFGSTEAARQDLAGFRKWTGVLGRFQKQRAIYDDPPPCLKTRFGACHWQDWLRFLASLRNNDPMTQLRAVNGYMNRHPYVQDVVNYGVTDYWAAPAEFFVNNGDCIDYTVAKYLSLRLLGWSPDHLRVVVLHDSNLNLNHAVLVAFVDGAPFVLDNQISQVVPAGLIRHYRPIYSLNEQRWWLHALRP